MYEPSSQAAMRAYAAQMRRDCPLTNVRRLYVLLAIALLFALQDFATVTHGTHETIHVGSDPAGAAVVLRCGALHQNAVTPAAIRIPRRTGDCVVTVSRSGYRTSTTTSERGVSPAFWLNFVGLTAIFGISDASPIGLSGGTGAALIVAGGLGLVVDAVDGAMREHKPAVIHVKLEPEAGDR